jgi:anhydro-N-acetylmuramic acid kinase
MGTRHVIGLASGSGGDGADAALVELEGSGLDLRARVAHACRQPFGPELSALAREACEAAAPVGVRQAALLHRLLGETFAAAARAVADQASFSLQKILCIGCPGHTVWHESGVRFPATLALGMPPVVAERCGVTAVSDFRARDVAAGGEGVPVSALADWLLFRHQDESRVLVHLGDVARVVYLPPDGRLSAVAGFEAGPCNGLIDGLMRHLTGGRENVDPGGRHAVQGRCLEPLVEEWLALPCLQRRPPGALPWNAFGADFVARAAAQAREQGGPLDLLCTATHFVARAVTRALARAVPAGGRVDRVLLSGGGVRNGLLWRLIEHGLGGVTVARTDEAGVPAPAREAVASAVLAALTLDGVPGNLPSATGAAGSRLLGSLTPGSSANWARCLQWMAAHSAPATDGEEE